MEASVHLAVNTASRGSNCSSSSSSCNGSRYGSDWGCAQRRGASLERPFGCTQRSAWAPGAPAAQELWIMVSQSRRYPLGTAFASCGEGGKSAWHPRRSAGLGTYAAVAMILTTVFMSERNLRDVQVVCRCRYERSKHADPRICG
jgi:hypothetical protein